MKHLVDVLIPTYNPNPAHLREALDSLKSQTFSNWKAFIHDDASEVDVESMVKPYLMDPRFTFEKSKVRLGIGKNWNACIGKTYAPSVAFLFQDDFWNPDYLETAINIFNGNPRAGFISINHEYRIEGNMKSEIGYKILREMKHNDLAGGMHDGKPFLEKWLRNGLWPNMIGEPDFVVMRRTAVEKAGLFNEKMNQLLDTDYWCRLLSACDFYFHKEDMGFFRVHETAASEFNRKTGASAIDRFRMLSSIANAAPKTLARTARIAQAKLCGKIGMYCVRHPVGSAKMMRWRLKI